MGHSTKTTRRRFLQTASVAVAAPYVITSKALGDDETPPASDRIVMGGIGIGNMGRGDQGNFLGRKDVQYVAMSDVRRGVREKSKGKVDGKYGNKDCKAYNDFRELIARDDIDAVHIATPDHWHAIMVIEACRAGKDVYCQKPESRTLREGPLMVAAARRYSRVVSGGSQRVLQDYRKIVNQCWGGELGTVKSINVNVGPLSKECNLPGSDAPDDIDCDLASVSPKLSNSKPDDRLSKEWQEKHEKFRIQPDILREWMEDYRFQLKFVVQTSDDLTEIQELLGRISGSIPPEKVLLMPEGTDATTIRGRDESLIDVCKQFGYRYCNRLHIEVVGNERGT